jgi:4-amino-4-deoxy-L-arabinose transferase-like glycosyltransferase
MKGHLQRFVWVEILLILLVGVVLLLPGIDQETGVSGQDEYRLTLRTPMEMLATGHWWTPWLDGAPRLKKPPLVYDCIAITYRTFGINLVSGRLWGVLAGAGLVVCCAVLYRQLFRGSGWLAGLICLGSFGVAVDARRAMLDLPLAVLVTLALLAAVKWGQTARARWLLLSALLLGLSTLAKGPVGLLFFGAATVAALFVKADLRRLVRTQAGWVLLAALIVVAFALSWPLSMNHLWPVFAKTLQEEMQARKFGQFSTWSPFSALGGALGLVMPWSFVVLVVLVHDLRHWREIAPARRWLVVFYLASALPFFFFKAFEHYFHPLLPAQCVMAALWLEQAAKKDRALLLRISAAVTALVAGLAAVFFLWFRLAPGLAWVVLFAALALLAVAWRSPFPRRVALSVAVVWCLLIGVLYPKLGVNGLPASLPAQEHGEAVMTYGSSQPGMLSMRLRHSVVELEKGNDHALLGVSGLVYLHADDAPSLLKAAYRLGLPAEKVGEFGLFYSRKVWVRFARKDATREDWRQAWRTRSLDALRVRFHIYRVGRGSA